MIHRISDICYEDSFRLAKAMPLDGTDAIVCVNDMAALGAINALKARGLRVPENIAVAGFDDNIFSRVSPVSITTVRQDVGRMAVSAAAWMLDRVQGREPDPELLRLIPCEVMPRQSTDRRRI